MISNDPSNMVDSNPIWKNTKVKPSIFKIYISFKVIEIIHLLKKNHVSLMAYPIAMAKQIQEDLKSFVKDRPRLSLLGHLDPSWIFSKV